MLETLELDLAGAGMLATDLVWTGCLRPQVREITLHNIYIVIAAAVLTNTLRLQKVRIS